MGIMEIEKRHREFSNKVARMVLEYNLNTIAEEIDNSIIPHQMEFVGYRERKLKTPFGEVEVRRKYYWSREKGEGISGDRRELLTTDEELHGDGRGGVSL